MTSEPEKQRLIFLDNLKILFVILVIFTHVMVTYGGRGSWYYYATINETFPVDIIATITLYMIAGIAAIFLPSIMGLFFLMGGYFTPKSYERKGAASFWKERLLRLGIPVLLYVLLINPAFYYLLAVQGIEPWSSTLAAGSFLEYYLGNFQTLPQIVRFITTFAITWFLVVLLILTAVYTLWKQITKSDSIRQRIPEELPIPKFIYLLLLAIGLGFLSFVVRIQFPIEQWPLGLPIGYMIQYLMMFSVGIIAVRYGWINQMRRHHVKVWAATIFAVVMLYFTYFFVFVGVDADYTLFFGGLNQEALVFALADNIICMGMIFVLIKLFYAKFNTGGNVQKILADNSYLVYLIHPFIVVPISLGLAPVFLSPLIKLAIVVPVSIILCYVIGHLLIQVFRKASRRA
ncbi:MAG: acyltransferase family protein [Candidatus Thorarchaeota archaeon]|jgi:fucose 4-O-acetylase-like acetyltransferase